jgi:anti-sigma regulatory factor (Ser/Thr protein kinase)
MVSTEINLALLPDSRAPSLARNSLADLEDTLGEEPLEHARLLVTELVTNSVVHGALGSEDRIRLRVMTLPEVLRFEVTDPGPGFEMPPLEDLEGGEAHIPLPDGVSGWGLYLLDDLSERWGVCREGVRPEERTCVWFELSREIGEADEVRESR